MPSGCLSNEWVNDTKGWPADGRPWTGLEGWMELNQGGSISRGKSTQAKKCRRNTAGGGWGYWKEEGMSVGSHNGEGAFQNV